MSTATAAPNPSCQVEDGAVLEQVERVLAHATFRNSKRFSTFLKYVVERTLQGETELKERVIGTEVFGRDPAYDTGSDPVVRAAACEVRKRLAQYYYDGAHDQEIRIDLPSGAYRPEFHLPNTSRSEDDAKTELPILVTPVSQPDPRGMTRTQWRWFAVGASLLAVCAAFVFQHLAAKPALDQFWGPVVSATGRVTLCVGTKPIAVDSHGATLLEASDGLPIHDWLPITDVMAVSKVAGFLDRNRVAYEIQSAGKTTLTEITQGPFVLIGAGNNVWTMRLTAPLRFWFQPRDGSNFVEYIGDRKNPGRRYSPGNEGEPGTTKDYAIVARYLDRTTGSLSVVVAGKGAAGTTAAGEFVTDPAFMQSFARERGTRLLSTRNIEFLISVQVIDGRPGAPHVEDFETW